MQLMLQNVFTGYVQDMFFEHVMVVQQNTGLVQKRASSS